MMTNQHKMEGQIARDMDNRVRHFIQRMDTEGIAHAEISLEDVGGYQSREVHGVLHPQSLSDLLCIVRTANEDRIPLHPYSTGKNWGFGSKTPVISGGFLVDLGILNKIRAIDFEKGTAEIEAGVDQQTLATALEGSAWMLNVSSAGGATGIISNALENGVGVYRKRKSDLLSIEAILGNGEFVNIGISENDIADDVVVSDFIQSNFSIVTAARISLLPRPQQIAIASMYFPTGDFSKVLASCRLLMQDSLIAGIPKIFNRDDDQLQLIAALDGSTTAIEEKIQNLRRVLARDVLVCYSGQDTDELIQSQLELFSGVPTNRAVKRYILKPGAELDIDAHAFMGFRLFAVAVPFESGHIDWCMEQLRTHAHDLTSLDYTWNLWSADTLGLVMYIHFARNAPGIQAAAKLQSELFDRFADRGIVPYRYDIDHMNHFEQDNPESFGRKKMLKMRFDPNQVILPGKYV